MWTKNFICSGVFGFLLTFFEVVGGPTFERGQDGPKKTDGDYRKT
jgi:hypothetical protein